VITQSDLLALVVDYLNSLTLSQSFTAVKQYRPTDKLISMSSDVFVNVAPGYRDRDRFDRGNKRLSTFVRIFVSKKIPGADLNLSSMLLLCEEIAESFTDKDLHDFRIVDLPEIDPVFVKDKFYTSAIFQSIITVECAVETSRYCLVDDESRDLEDGDGLTLCL